MYTRSRSSDPGHAGLAGLDRQLDIDQALVGLLLQGKTRMLKYLQHAPIIGMGHGLKAEDAVAARQQGKAFQEQGGQALALKLVRARPPPPLPLSSAPPGRRTRWR